MAPLIYGPRSYREGRSSASREGSTCVPTSVVTETLDRLESLAKERGLTIFSRINFSADARRAGLSPRPTELLILGSPKAGTPLMAATPTLARESALSESDRISAPRLAMRQRVYR